jgi:hypothetical protein
MRCATTCALPAEVAGGAYPDAVQPHRCAGLAGQSGVAREAREALGLSPDAWIVGNVGRLHPDKDQATLLHGFATALPGLPGNSQLVILGKGRLEQDLKAQARELGSPTGCCFSARCRRTRRYFRAFDVFALSSDHEPFGMVLLEAMAAGVPLPPRPVAGEGSGRGRGHVPAGRCRTPGPRAATSGGMDDQQRRQCAELMLDRLRERSPTAVRDAFWPAASYRTGAEG